MSTPFGRVAPAPHTPEGSSAVLAELRDAVLERRDYADADALALRLPGPLNEA
jgi:hypothetical protein